jgi:hypothetical protein
MDAVIGKGAEFDFERVRDLAFDATGTVRNLAVDEELGSANPDFFDLTPEGIFVRILVLKQSLGRLTLDLELTLGRTVDAKHNLVISHVCEFRVGRVMVSERALRLVVAPEHPKDRFTVVLVYLTERFTS